jgi:hypothetical protein
MVVRAEDRKCTKSFSFRHKDLVDPADLAGEGLLLPVDGDLAELLLVLSNVVGQRMQQQLGMLGVMTMRACTRALGTPGRMRVKSITNSAGECEMMARFE